MTSSIATPKISVIVPIYKISTIILRKCIESLLKQSFKEFEIILIDDNFYNDDCGTMCDELKSKYNNIVTVHQKNQGVSVARNVGLLVSKGEWIAFVDPDDWLDKDYLYKLYENSNGVEVVMCSCYVNYAKLQNKNKFFEYEEKLFRDQEKDEILLQLICGGSNNYFPPEIGVGVPWGKIYRKDFLIKNNLKFEPELVRMQDNVFNLYVIEHASKVYYFNQYLYHYRKSNNSVTIKYNPRVVEYIERVNEATKLFIVTQNKGKIFYNAFYSKILFGLMEYFYLYYLPAVQNKYKKYTAIKLEIINTLNGSMYQEAIKQIDKSSLSNKGKVYIFLLKKHCIFLLFSIAWLKLTMKTLKKGMPQKAAK